jgi:hypothetical protein
MPPRKTRSAAKASTKSDHDTAQRAWIPPKTLPKSKSKPVTRQVTKEHEQQEREHNDVERWQAEQLAIKRVNLCLVKSDRSRLIRKVSRLQLTVRRLRAMRREAEAAKAAAPPTPVVQMVDCSVQTQSQTLPQQTEIKYVPVAVTSATAASAQQTVEWWHPGKSQTTGLWSCCSREVLMIENGCCQRGVTSNTTTTTTTTATTPSIVARSVLIPTGEGIVGF